MDARWRSASSGDPLPSRPLTYLLPILLILLVLSPYPSAAASKSSELDGSCPLKVTAKGDGVRSAKRGPVQVSKAPGASIGIRLKVRNDGPVAVEGVGVGLQIPFEIKVGPRSIHEQSGACNLNRLITRIPALPSIPPLGSLITSTRA